MMRNNFNWSALAATWDAWWSDRLGRPVFTLQFPKPAAPSASGLPFHTYQAFYDFAIPAGEIIARYDEWLRHEEFYADSFPHFWPNFGPGVLAAFLGGTAVCGQDTVWFEAGRHAASDIADIHLALDPDCAWFRRVDEIMRAAVEYWEGRVQVDMTELAGSLDVLDSLRPSSQLLFDLYDSPGQVKRLVWEIHEAFWQAYDHFAAIIEPSNPGSTSWLGNFATAGNIVLQCDFAYMISPEMFAEFVLPELRASCQKRPYSIYHLDGKGQLPHLDLLLSIPELSGIQWVAGAGEPDSRHWPEVYRKITRAGKRAFVCVDRDPAIIDAVIRQTDAPELLHFHCYGPPEAEDAMRRKIAQWRLVGA